LQILPLLIYIQAVLEHLDKLFFLSADNENFTICCESCSDFSCLKALPTSRAKQSSKGHSSSPT